MIFTNGDCSITYQQNETIPQEKQETVKAAFNQLDDKQYFTDIITTENTITFLYEPISIMETHNTIEPSNIVISEAAEFLSEKGFL